MWLKPYSTRPVGVQEARRKPVSKGARAFLDSADPAAPPIRDLPLDDARQAMDELMLAVDQPGPDVAMVEDAVGPEVQGEAARLRCYTPSMPDGAPPRGILIFLHGGGWTLGNTRAYDGFARRLCQATGHLVASVDYPLSPEHKYPTALHAGLSAIHWAIHTAHRLDLPPGALALAGDSAGGTLAAALALRTARSVRLSHLALFYPVMVIEDQPEHASRAILGDGTYFLSREDISWAAGNYLSEPGQARLIDASPLLAPSFDHLPPVTVITAGYDPLRDEGADFVRRVTGAGVDARLYCFEGVVHGFMGLSQVMDESRTAFDLLARRMR
ncbi:alpha/beta hydrolase [Maricaulis sp.]|uniref:alpha/beta hydrolase n=1 Tax=Maricaulis sp. TaxID=1486257 RepID=UPI003A9274F6